MKFNRRSQIGAGLVETLMVVVFISISIVALAQFQHYLVSSTHNTQQENDALILGSKQIETLRDYTVLTTTTNYVAYSNISSGTGTAAVSGTTFTLTWTITTSASPADKVINVAVSWTDRTNVARSITLTSIVSQLDPSGSANLY